MHPRIPRRVIAILTAKAFGTNLETLRSGSRYREHTTARFAVWHMVRELRPETSLEQMGDMLDKDYSTAFHGLERAKGLADLNRDFISRLDRAREMIAQWCPEALPAAEMAAPAMPVAKKIETPPAVQPEAPRQLRSLSRAPESCGGFEYDAWFKASCKRSEERFLRIASAIHPERVRVPVKGAAE